MWEEKHVWEIRYQLEHSVFLFGDICMLWEGVSNGCVVWKSSKYRMRTRCYLKIQETPILNDFILIIQYFVLVMKYTLRSFAPSYVFCNQHKTLNNLYLISRNTCHLSNRFSKKKKSRCMPEMFYGNYCTFLQESKGAWMA